MFVVYDSPRSVDALTLMMYLLSEAFGAASMIRLRLFLIFFVKEEIAFRLAEAPWFNNGWFVVDKSGVATSLHISMATSVLCVKNL